MQIDITGFPKTSRVLIAKVVKDISTMSYIHNIFIHKIALVSKFPMDIDTDEDYIFIRIRCPNLFHKSIEGYASIKNGIIDKTDIIDYNTLMIKLKDEKNGK